eukprot:scaffold254430_cov31-Tisochrysis_lutea.AAC.7
MGAKCPGGCSKGPASTTASLPSAWFAGGDGVRKSISTPQAPLLTDTSHAPGTLSNVSASLTLDRLRPPLVSAKR